MSKKLFVFGVDYKTSDIGIRERMAFSKVEIAQAMERLHNLSVANEVVIISTCNRTEIYCITRDVDLIINAVGEIKNLCPKTVIRKCCYIYSELDAVSHLFRVVSGLESMVLGETEIVAQVKDAFDLAKQNHMVGRNLSGIFQMALSVEKEVRNITAINNVAISMGRAVTNLIAVNYSDLLSTGVLFVGAGDMMRTIVPHFKNIVTGKKTVINRTQSKAKELAGKIEAKFNKLDELSNIVNDYSVIIACCYADKPMINEQLLSKAIKNNQKILIVDLSIPLIIDINLKKYDNIDIVTVDDIAKIVDVGVEKRKHLVGIADDIIKGKLQEYKKWHRKRGLSPVIKAIRDKAEFSRQEVLVDAQKQVINGAPIDVVLQELSIKLTNKLMHLPTVNVCVAEGVFQEDLVNLMGYLYDLPEYTNS